MDWRSASPLSRPVVASAAGVAGDADGIGGGVRAASAAATGDSLRRMLPSLEKTDCIAGGTARQRVGMGRTRAGNSLLAVSTQPRVLKKRNARKRARLRERCVTRLFLWLRSGPPALMEPDPNTYPSQAPPTSLTKAVSSLRAGRNRNRAPTCHECGFVTSI